MFAVQRNWGQLKPCLSSHYSGSVETVVDVLIVSIQQMYSALSQFQLECLRLVLEKAISKQSF